MLPLEYLDELKSHPALSFKASIDNVGKTCFAYSTKGCANSSKDALIDYTGVGGVEAWGAHQILSKMNPTLGTCS